VIVVLVVAALPVLLASSIAFAQPPERPTADLKALAGDRQVVSVSYCRGIYMVALKDGSARTFKEYDLAFQKRVRLPILVERDRPLLNLYSVMEVNPANGPKVNTAGGKAFADFMVSADVQKVIKTFGVDKYGQPLFVPVAGTREEDVGRTQ